MALIRPEAAEDRQAVHDVNERAFGRTAEADLVDALRTSARPQVSLVAVEDGRVVGHIFFSPVSIEAADSVSSAMGLAPMAVLPEYQKHGIGSQLVRQGLEACLRTGHAVVFVLGHADYYPRFGFTPARALGLTCIYPVPDEAFMVVKLKDGALARRRGIVKYMPEFDEV